MVVNVIFPGLFQINWGNHTSLGTEDNESTDEKEKTKTQTQLFPPIFHSHCRKHETIGSDIES